jgi:hypothetical protein
MVRSCHCAAPRSLSWRTDNLAEEDPLHNAQWRPSNRPPHAHYSICYAKQIEATEEAHVLLLRSMPETRCAGKAATGVDSGLVGAGISELIEEILTAEQQRHSIRSTSAQRICTRKHIAIRVWIPELYHGLNTDTLQHKVTRC